MLDLAIFLKILFTIFLVILIPIYWKNYGWRNFLWFSDIGLFFTFFIIWWNSSLLNSMVIIGIMPFELVWAVDYALHLVGFRALGISDYMFDTSKSVFLRALSLFHLFLPVIWIFYLIDLGYDPRAIWYQTLLFWAVLAVTYFVTDPKQNVNWVFQPQALGWQRISPGVWVFLMAVVFPIVVFYPLHLALELLI